MLLTLSELVAAHRFLALDHDLTNWAKQLIVHARAALLVQQIKANVVVFDGRIELDRNGDETEGENAAGDGPSHPVRLSCRWTALWRQYVVRSGMGDSRRKGAPPPSR